MSQFRSSPDLEDNVARHVDVAVRAAREGCRLVVFPELSLTGYEPSRAHDEAMDLGDPRLEPLQAVADTDDIVIVCGAPLRAQEGVEIGAVVFAPHAARTSYAKQCLHADEQPVFVAGTRELQISIDAHRVALGICFESVQPHHIADAARCGATLYVASVAKPAKAVEAAHLLYADKARNHRIPVVVANAVGLNDGFVSAGRSAGWDATGALLECLGSREPGVLMLEV